jgi:hypothetical protein
VPLNYLERLWLNIPPLEFFDVRNPQAGMTDKEEGPPDFSAEVSVEVGIGQLLEFFRAKAETACKNGFDLNAIEQYRSCLYERGQ